MQSHWNQRNCVSWTVSPADSQFTSDRRRILYVHHVFHSCPCTFSFVAISDTSDPSSPPPNSSVEVVTVVTQEEGRPLDLTVIQGHRDKYGVASTKPTNPPPSKNSKGAFGMCHHKRDSPYSRPSVDRSATARIKSTKMVCVPVNMSFELLKLLKGTAQCSVPRDIR